MFETLKNVFRVKEMRRKLLYVLWMILVIRIGSQLPVPGVDSDFFKEWFAKNTGDAFNFFDAFTGGSFTHYHAASHNCHSGSGGDAERWRRGQKENYCHYPLCNCWSCVV